MTDDVYSLTLGYKLYGLNNIVSSYFGELTQKGGKYSPTTTQVTPQMRPPLENLTA
jgi:hypothetical protein